MEPNPDCCDMLKALNDARVRYLIVGAYAVVYHSEPRYTKDLDIWIEPNPKNAERVWRGLKQFGAPLKDIEPALFEQEDMVYYLGREPNRIDIIMSVDGLDFDSAWRNRIRTTLGGVPVSILNAQDTLKAKRAAGRPQDLLDVQKMLLHKPAARRKKKTKGKR